MVIWLIAYFNTWGASGEGFTQRLYRASHVRVVVVHTLDMALFTSEGVGGRLMLPLAVACGDSLWR